MATNYTIKSDETLLKILRVLRNQYSAGVTEIAERTKKSKGGVHRHLNTLEQEGLVVNENGTYRLSLWFFDIGTYVREQHGLYAAVKEELDDFAEDTAGHVWCLAEEQGRGIMIYARVAKSHRSTPMRLGQRTYLHQSAAGKAVLAHLPAEYADRVVDRHGLPTAGPNTITDRNELDDAIEEIRSRGYALNDEESGREFRGVGVPVFDEDDRVIGGISVVGPKWQLKGEYWEETLPSQLRRIANEIRLNIVYGPS